MIDHPPSSCHPLVSPGARGNTRNILCSLPRFSYTWDFPDPKLLVNMFASPKIIINTFTTTLYES